MRKVLFLIDDDEITLLTIEKKFEKYSELFSMVTARSRAEATQTVQQTAISLVVLDLDMPDLEGEKFLSRLLEEFSEIPVITVTTRHPGEISSLSPEAKVVASVSKPFDIDDLGNAIINTLQSEANGGVMHNVSPVVFLQLIQMEGKTCTIRLIDSDGSKGGVLYFRDGLMIDARADKLSGLQAAYRVITWENVTLFIQNKCTARKNLINRSLQAIILRAMSLKDESYDPPIDESPVDLSFENHPVAEEEEGLQENLTDLEFFEDLEDVVLPELVDNTAAANALHLENIRDIVSTRIGERCGVEDIYHDDSMENTFQFLTELGAMFRVGTPRVGYISQDGGEGRILLPGSPISILNVSSKCPHDKLMQVLSQAFS
ncbi:MAG: response regulator [Deltaproteobacteria bacterium]|nr:response regulator [Deltaproteobacteria bacterium]